MRREYNLEPYKHKLIEIGRGRKDVKGNKAWKAYAKAAQKLDKRHMLHGDEGYDAPDGADVKGTTVPYRGLMVKQDQYKKKIPSIYVLGHVNGWRVRLLGWISRSEFDELKREEPGRPNPAADTELGRSGVNWVVDVEKLHPMWEKGQFPGV
jgi:hypothetical protein